MFYGLLTIFVVNVDVISMCALLPNIISCIILTELITELDFFSLYFRDIISFVCFALYKHGKHNISKISIEISMYIVCMISIRLRVNKQDFIRFDTFSYYWIIFLKAKTTLILGKGSLFIWNMIVNLISLCCSYFLSFFLFFLIKLHEKSLFIEHWKRILSF